MGKLFSAFERPNVSLYRDFTICIVHTIWYCFHNWYQLWKQKCAEYFSDFEKLSLYMFWQKCLSKLQYIEFENMYVPSFSYNLKRRWKEIVILIQFVSRLFIKSLFGDKVNFSLLTIWPWPHTHYPGVKYFLGENSIYLSTNSYTRYWRHS